MIYRKNRLFRNETGGFDIFSYNFTSPMQP